MAISMGDNLDFEGNEIQNVRLQNLGTDPASPVTGQIWFNTTSAVAKIRLAAATAILAFVGSVTPQASTVGGAGSSGSSVYASPQDHVHPDIGLASGTHAGHMSTTHYNMLANATSAATANTLVLLDGNGRAKVADPSGGQDIANYQWTVQQIALAKQGLAWKLPVRSVFTSNLAGTYVAGTKRITASASGILANNDGVTSWAAGDRIALNGQSTGTQNGLYVIIDPGTASTPWILERTSDFGGPGAVAGDVLSGAFFVVKEGTEYGDTSWVCSNNAVTVDTTAIAFQQDVKATVDNSTIELNSSGNMQVKDGGITYAKIQSLSACSLFGRAANSAGVGASIAASTNDRVLARTGDSLQFVQVSNSMLATMAARSVKLNATNATAAPTDSAPGAGDRVLQSNAANTALEWGQVRTAGIADGAVTYAKIQNVSAQYRVLGRISSGAGITEELTPANLRALLASDVTNGVQLKAVQYTIGDGTLTSITITHNLGSQNIVGVFMRRTSNNGFYAGGWTAPTTNTVVCTFGTAPAANSVVVTILYV